jgi:hypothetical protein
MRSNGGFKLFVACLVLVFASSCARLTTVYATFHAEGSNLEQVWVIVDRTLGEFEEPAHHRNTKSGFYLIWGKENKFGIPIGYVFNVRYKVEEGHVIVQIENTRLAATQDELAAANGYLSEIASKINTRLKEAGIEATVKTGSRWSPALYE